MLRRAGALRTSQELESAADLARRARDRAKETGETELELSACLEMGQALLRSELGEGYLQASTEVDLDGAEEAFEQAAELAENLNDQHRLAAATRELGIITVSRLRADFVNAVYAGEHMGILQRLAKGEKLDDVLPGLPFARLAEQDVSL
jgi:hypothetical protein